MCCRCGLRSRAGDEFMGVTWLIHTCDTTHSYVWHDSCICVTLPIHSRVCISGGEVRVTWRIHTCDTTQSYMWHDSFIRVTWLIHTCGITHSYVWYNSCMRVTWLTYMSKRLWRVSSKRKYTRSCEYIMSHPWMSPVTHMNEPCHTYEWVMSQIWMSHVNYMSRRL